MARMLTGAASVSVILLVALAITGRSGVLAHQPLRAQLQELRAENQRLARANRGLRRQVRGLRQHPDVIRAAIRDELGFVAAHEVVVQFVGDAGGLHGVRR